MYPKGDLRRMLVVVAAVASIPSATLVKIATRTGLDKKTVTRLISQAIEQACVGIEKNGPVYSLTDWGPVLKERGAIMALTGALNAPNIETS